MAAAFLAVSAAQAHRADVVLGQGAIEH